MLYTIDSQTCNESNVPLTKSVVTCVSADLSTAEMTRLQSLVSAKDAEIEQLRAENERLRAGLPTTAHTVPTPCTSVETLVSTCNTTTDNLASAGSSQYLETQQRIKARILSAWTAAGFNK
jgi:hypothetical protein